MLRRLVAELGPRWSTITMLWPLAPPRSGASLKRRLGRLDGQTEPPLDDELQLVGALDGDELDDELSECDAYEDGSDGTLDGPDDDMDFDDGL